MKKFETRGRGFCIKNSEKLFIKHKEFNLEIAKYVKKCQCKNIDKVLQMCLNCNSLNAFTVLF